MSSIASSPISLTFVPVAVPVRETVWLLLGGWVLFLETALPGAFEGGSPGQVSDKRCFISLRLDLRDRRHFSHIVREWE